MDFISAFDPMQMILFMALIFGDILLGAAAALKTGTFTLQHVANGLKDKAMPFGIVLVILKVISVASAGSDYAVWAHTVFNIAWTTIAIALLGSIALNVSTVIGKPVEVGA